LLSQKLQWSHKDNNTMLYKEKRHPVC
jgi:hypothetical protein